MRRLEEENQRLKSLVAVIGDGNVFVTTKYHDEYLFNVLAGEYNTEPYNANNLVKDIIRAFCACFVKWFKHGVDRVATMFHGIHLLIMLSAKWMPPQFIVLPAPLRQ